MKEPQDDAWITKEVVLALTLWVNVSMARVGRAIFGAVVGAFTLTATVFVFGVALGDLGGWFLVGPPVGAVVGLLMGAVWDVDFWRGASSSRNQWP